MPAVAAYPLDPAQSLRVSQTAISRVSDLIDRVLGRDPLAGSTRAPILAPLPVSATDPAFLEQSRAGIVQFLWKMYLGDPSVMECLDNIGILAARPNPQGRSFEFTFKAPRGATVKMHRMIQERDEQIERMLERRLPRPGVNANRRAASMLKWGLLEGASYYEIEVKGQAIVGLRYIPGPREGFILRRITEGDGTFAYREKFLGYALVHLGTGQIVQVFHPWQVATWGWNDLSRGEGDEYIGLYHAARKLWMQLQDSEQDLYVARKERAYVKYVHELPGLSIQQLMQRAREHDEERRKHPRGVSTDIWTSGKVTVLDPSNTQLSRTGDMEYRQAILFGAGHIPKGLRAGYGQDVNRAVLDRQTQAFNWWLDEVSNMGSMGIESLVDLQLILWGYHPEDWPYEIRWTEKSIELPLERAQRLQILKTTGFIAAETGAEIEGLNWSIQRERMAAEVEDAMGPRAEARAPEDEMAAIEADGGEDLEIEERSTQARRYLSGHAAAEAMDGLVPRRWNV